MPLNGGGGLIYVGDKLIAGEIRQPYPTTLGRVATIKTVAAAAHEQDPTSPTEVLASAAEDYHWLWVGPVVATVLATNNSQVVLEVWFGAAGVEVLQARFNIGYRNASSSIASTVISCPFYIPAGTRVSYTTRSARTGQSVSLVTRFGRCDSPVPDQPVTSTVDTAASKGIVLNESGSVNTWGNWTPIWESTPVDFQGFHFTPSCNGATVVNAATSRFELGIGASSSEVAFPNEWRVEHATTEAIWFQPAEGPMYFHRPTPAGSRIVCRTQRSAGSAFGWDVILNGIPI